MLHVERVNYWKDGTILSSDSFSDNCPYRVSTEYVCQNSQSQWRESTRDKEYFGPQSACFTGDLSGGIDQPYCLKQSVKTKKF